jgi:hypothetical protein
MYNNKLQKWTTLWIDGPHVILTKCLGARAKTGSYIRAHSSSLSSSLSSN